LAIQFLTSERAVSAGPAFLPKHVGGNAKRELRAGLIAYMRKTAGKLLRLTAKEGDTKVFYTVR
jgi:hypothetical protein